MVLLGAGVSVPLGIPAMRGIYSDFLRKGKSGITNSERHACKFFVETLGIQPDLEELLLALNLVKEFEQHGLAAYIEKAVSHHSFGTKIEKYRERKNRRMTSVLGLQTRVLEFLSQLCFRFDRDKAFEYLGDFVEAVAIAGCPVFTTNYDFALEHVAAEKGIRIEDNFLPRGLRRVWNPSVDFPLGNALTLIQVHGSVTWYADSDGTVEKIQAPTDMNPVGRDVKQLIIFPTRYKGVYDPHFFPLYAHFLTVLTNIDLLIIAGHSLRDDYLRAGIVHQLQKRKLPIIVLDPIFPEKLKFELERTTGRLDGAVTHVPCLFEEFADELAGFIRSSNPTDIPKRSLEIMRFRQRKSPAVVIRGNIRLLKASESKSFSVRVETNLRPQDKPAVLRVWLAALLEGENLEVCEEFLESPRISFGKDCVGIIKTDFPMKIMVPEHEAWSDCEKVTLHVALIKDTVKEPGRIRAEGIIASAQRNLRYKID